MNCFRTRFYKVRFGNQFLLPDGTGPYTRVGKQSAQGVTAAFVQVALSSWVFVQNRSFNRVASVCGQSGGGGGGDALPAPPVPEILFGFRDSPTESSVGCSDFNAGYPESGISAVNVYRGTVSGGPYALVHTFLLPDTLFDTGLDSGTDYFYVLRSVGDGITYLAEESEASAEIPVPA